MSHYDAKKGLAHNRKEKTKVCIYCRQSRKAGGKWNKKKYIKENKIKITSWVAERRGRESKS